MIEIELTNIIQSSTNPLKFQILLSEVKGVREFSFPAHPIKSRALIVALDNKKMNMGIHHLYIQTLNKMNIQFNKVTIMNYEHEEFETKLVLKKEDSSLLLMDCNIYDALIFSVLTFCPIYIEETTLDLLVQEYNQYIETKSLENSNTLPKDNISYKKIHTPYLEKMLSLAIEKEEYEKAISIKEELQKRKSKN